MFGTAVDNGTAASISEQRRPGTKPGGQAAVGQRERQRQVYGMCERQRKRQPQSGMMHRAAFESFRQKRRPN